MKASSILTLLLLTVCYLGMEVSGRTLPMEHFLVRNVRTVIECGRNGEHAHIDRNGCKNGGLGCNAYNQWDCRFCGFGHFNGCGGGH